MATETVVQDTSVRTSMFYIDTAYESDIRYDLAKFLRQENDNYDPMTSQFLYSLKELTSAGQITVTVEEFRPDLLSYNVYNSCQYWWILLAYNNIIDVRDLIAGKILLYPSVSDIESIYFNLKSLEQ